MIRLLNMNLLNLIWKISSLIIAAFLLFELIVVSPLLLFVYTIYRISVYLAPDVFTVQSVSASKARKILLCVDPTSVSSFRWITQQFPLNENDQLVLIHVVEPTESIQIPANIVTFNPTTIDTKDFVIPQYLSEICHWLKRNQYYFEGVLMRPYAKCTVAETILKFAQKNHVDCIIASASQRTGT